MFHALPSSPAPRHFAGMPKGAPSAAHKPVHPDVTRAARAVKMLREELKLTQRQVSEAHPRQLTYQRIAQVEQGKVPGIVKPQTQREMLAALSNAARLETPLTLDDFAGYMDRLDTATVEQEGGDLLALRLARTLAPPKAERQAVFPTREGDVIFTFPADLSPQGFREIEAYFQAFVQANSRRD